MITKSNKARFGAAFTGALMLGATFGANATPITQLALAIDASGSINVSQWTTQVKGYSAALQTVLPDYFGSISVSVIRFGETATVVRGMTAINDIDDLNDLADFFWTTTTQLDQSGNGSFTCISCGIELAEGTLSGTATYSIIDVSTDGLWNRGVNPNGGAGIVGTAEWAVANNATVLNAIGIGVTPDFEHGTGSFSIVADTFDDFEDTLVQKLTTEIDPGPGCDQETTTCDPNHIPEPGTLALFGLGLVSLGFARRRKVI